MPQNIVKNVCVVCKAPIVDERVCKMYVDGREHEFVFHEKCAVEFGKRLVKVSREYVKEHGGMMIYNTTYPVPESVLPEAWGL